jgi:LDH2 family malate/lactate/ureidoglycolate dehydrogenase
MHLTVAEARTLVDDVMRRLGHDAVEAALIADHLIDCELRGVHYGGLARAISIAERERRATTPPQPLHVEHETAVSARINGGDRIGYVVAHAAAQLAAAKATSAGIAIVGAHNTWYTGMLSYYAEMAANQGLVTILASNATPWVAPHGSTEGRVGTNPICVGFPSSDGPVIWDVGTSAIMHAEVLLAQRLGLTLPEGVAFDREGSPTRDPAAALDGAFATWGGHKGSGLAVVVQILGALAGAPFMPPDLARFGFLVLTFRPDLVSPSNGFASEVATFARAMRAARPLDPQVPVRMPFDRSRAERARRLAEDRLEVPEAVVAALRAIADEPPAGQP